MTLLIPLTLSSGPSSCLNHASRSNRSTALFFWQQRPGLEKKLKRILSPYYLNYHHYSFCCDIAGSDYHNFFPLEFLWYRLFSYLQFFSRSFSYYGYPLRIFYTPMVSEITPLICVLVFQFGLWKPCLFVLSVLVVLVDFTLRCFSTYWILCNNCRWTTMTVVAAPDQFLLYPSCTPVHLTPLCIVIVVVILVALKWCRESRPRQTTPRSKYTL